MASIPRYRAEQRLGSQGPYQVANPSQARQRGEDLAQLGGAIMKAATVTAQYNEMKDKADISEAKTSFDTEAALHGQMTATDVISNKDGNTALDGSNMQELYSNSFNELYAKANEIQNPRARTAAINAVKRQERMQGARVQTAQVAAHANFIYNQAEKNTFSAAAVVGNDPSQYQDQMKGLLESYQAMGLDPQSYKKASDLAEESLSLAAIQHYTDKQDYLGAEKIIKEKLTGTISPEKRQRLLDKVDSDRREFLSEKYLTKNREHDERERLRKEKSEEIAANAYSGLMSQDPVEQARARDTMREAFQQKRITKEAYIGFLSVEDKFLERESDAEVVMYSKRLAEGRDMQNFTSDIMNNASLTNGDKKSLLNEFRRAGGSTKPNRIYQQKFSKAQKFINDAFPRRPFEEPEVRAGKMAMAQRLFLEGVDKGETNLFKAAINAVKEVDPTNLALPQMEGTPSAKELNEELARIKRRFNEIQKTSADQAEVDRLLKRVQEIKSIKSSIEARGASKGEEK